jgi:uncharacterized protein with von Willebrand factor type A (vWA) domain
MMGEALKRLRHMRSRRTQGPGQRGRNHLPDHEKRRGDRNCLRPRLKDRLKVILAIDNGGWSMDPYIPVVQTLFDYARDQFKEVKTYFFHNTIYDYLWEDPARYKNRSMLRFPALDPETRLILVGDASMAPYELMSQDGSIHITVRSGRPSIECLKFLAETFAHSVWLNPVSAVPCGITPDTIGHHPQIFPMFELSIDGLEKAVQHRHNG